MALCHRVGEAQYGHNTCCCVRPGSWEKDRLRYMVAFGDDVFGGAGLELRFVASEVAKRCPKKGGGEQVALAPRRRDQSAHRRNFGPLVEISSFRQPFSPAAWNHPHNHPETRLTNGDCSRPAPVGRLATSLVAR